MTTSALLIVGSVCGVVVIADVAMWLYAYWRSERGIWGQIEANMTVASINLILAALGLMTIIAIRLWTA